jgi:hypothetical protein
VLVKGSIGTLTNQGTITGPAGVVNAAFTTIVGTTLITAVSTISALTNSGTIAGTAYGVKNESYGYIGDESNSGSISGNTGIDNDGTIGALRNTGTITGVEHGILNDGTIAVISNFGTAATIGQITNNGAIQDGMGDIVN